MERNANYSVCCGFLNINILLPFISNNTQQLEQEIEHIREGHRMLESSTARREKLEGALRAKLEKQVRSLRGENVHFKGECNVNKGIVC